MSGDGQNGCRLRRGVSFRRGGGGDSSRNFLEGSAMLSIVSHFLGSVKSPPRGGVSRCRWVVPCYGVRQELLARSHLLRRSTIRPAQGIALGGSGARERRCRPNGPTVHRIVGPLGRYSDLLAPVPQGSALGWANRRAFGPKTPWQEFLPHPSRLAWLSLRRCSAAIRSAFSPWS